MTGRVRALLVEGGPNGERAVATHVVALASVEPRADRVRFLGTGVFDPAVQTHICSVIVPLVDHILDAVQQPRHSYDISIANIGAASAADLGIRVSGFSADVPVLTAVLSASLGVPFADSIVATGHVASIDGHITMVRGLPAKLAAALADQSVRRFVHPALGDVDDLSALAPQEHARVARALRAARERLAVTAVRDIGEYVCHAFDEEEILLASLRRGFFETQAGPELVLSTAGRAAAFLLADNARRFWSVLERRLLNGDADATRKTLGAYVSFYTTRERYPRGFGRMLLDLVRSLPPGIHRLKRLVPLIPTGECLRLAQHGAPVDHDDVPLLLDAASGRIGERRVSRREPMKEQPPGPDGPAEAILDAILNEISSQALARKFDRPIDEARAVYRIDSITVESYDSFLDAISAFYLHLERHAGLAGPAATPEAVAADAQDCLERALVRSGGLQGAWSEAHEPLKGGLGFIFNVMTQQFKNDARGKHVRWVFRNAMDPLDWDGRVALLAALLRRVGPQLPADIRSQPAARFAKHVELVIDAYVRSLHPLETILRSM